MDPQAAAAQYWVQVPAGATPGTRFEATTGSTRRALAVPPGMPAGEWMVVTGAPITASATTGTADASQVIVAGVLVEPNAPQSASASGAAAGGVGITSLMKACRLGNLKTVTILLDNKADANEVTGGVAAKCAPLSIAAEEV